MFITQAYAQDATTPANMQGGLAGGLSSFLPLLLIFAVFYFLLIRPQQKKAREHQKLVTSLKRGDKIITNGGIYGSVSKVEDETGILHVEIAPDVKIRIRRDAVSEVPNRTEIVTETPVKDTK